MNFKSEMMSQDHLKKDLIEIFSRVLPAFVGWKIYHQYKDIWELCISDEDFFPMLVFFFVSIFSYFLYDI